LQKVFYYVLKLYYQYIFHAVKDRLLLDTVQSTFFLLQELSLKPLENAMQTFPDL